MKMSISVPDDLWRRVAAPGESPSAVVQRALEALRPEQKTEVHRRAPAELLPELLDTELSDAVDRLRHEMNEIRNAGYRAAVTLARSYHWRFFDGLPSTERAVVQLCGIDETELYSTVLSAAREAGATSTGQLTHGGRVLDDELPLDSFVEGFAAGLLDMKDRVRRANSEA